MGKMSSGGGELRGENASLSPQALNNRNCFGKEYRLLSRRDFLSLKDGSKMVQDGYLRIFYKKFPGQKVARVGFAVSRKVGGAAVRNKIKRILREEFRTSPFKGQGLDALIVVKIRKILGRNLRESFHRCFGQMS